MPAIIAKSIAILSDAGLGMAMFSLGMWSVRSSDVFPSNSYLTHLIVMESIAGLFMALQPRIIACGNKVATFAMAVRFLMGPAVMAASSIVVGLRGVLLHIAIVQVSCVFEQTCLVEHTIMPLLYLGSVAS